MNLQEDIQPETYEVVHMPVMQHSPIERERINENPAANLTRIGIPSHEFAGANQPTSQNFAYCAEGSKELHHAKQ